MFLRSHDSDPVHPTRCPMTFALRRGVSANSARTCGSKASKLVALARRVGYFGGESEASARSTVFFAQPTSLAILRIDKPCPRRYRICAHCSKEITHPIFFGWATFRGAFWATFQRALTPSGLRGVPTARRESSGHTHPVHLSDSCRRSFPRSPYPFARPA